MAALLEAKVSLASIMDQEKCSRAFIYKVKGLVEAGHGFQRQKGSGGANKNAPWPNSGRSWPKSRKSRTFPWPASARPPPLDYEI